MGKGIGRAHGTSHDVSPHGVPDPSDGRQSSAQVESTTYAMIGREEFSKSMAAFARRVVDNYDTFPPEVNMSNLHGLHG